MKARDTLRPALWGKFIPRFPNSPATQARMRGEQSTRWEELASRIQQGDRAAEEELGTVFHQRVLVMAAVRLRDPEAAREIAQEALLAVLQGLRDGKLREPHKLAAFVLGTARNLVNNHLRAQTRHPSPVPLNPDEPTMATFPTGVEVKEERSLVVRAALQHLKPLERKILLLTLLEGMNPREIAARVGLKPENVRTRKARAIKSIIQELSKVSRK